MYEGLEDEFRNATWWKEFKTIIGDRKGDITGINNKAAENARLSINDNILTIEGLNTKDTISITNANGQTVYQGTANTISLSAGLYIVKTKKNTQKIIIE